MWLPNVQLQVKVCVEGSAEVRLEPENVGSSRSVSGGQRGQNVEALTAGVKDKNERGGGNVGSSGLN